LRGIRMDKDRDETYEAMEEIFGIHFEYNEERERKRNKLKELKEKYKQKFGEEIDYSNLDLSYGGGFDEHGNSKYKDGIDGEIQLVEEALEDDKPFEPIEYHDIYFRGHKLDWFD